MVKLGAGFLTLAIGMLFGVTVAFGQTATPTNTPTPTTTTSTVTNTPTATPTGTVLPAQAPSTGFGTGN
jgi:hypothetical protein